jgi:hypothetical protein
MRRSRTCAASRAGRGLGYLEIRVDGAVDVVVHDAHVRGDSLNELCESRWGDTRIEGDLREILVPELPHLGKHTHVRHSRVVVSPKPREEERHDALHGVKLVSDHSAAIFLVLAREE